jgi:hypothetical protein
MKYSAFEQAAIEASAGLKEIDAEFEQLEARKQALESKRELLETLVHQLLMVLPTSNQSFPADGSEKPGPLTAASTTKPSSFATGASDSKSFSLRKEEWPAFVQQSTANPLERK